MPVPTTKYADSCVSESVCLCLRACVYRYIHMSRFLTKFYLWRFHFFSPILPQLETDPNALCIVGTQHYVCLLITGQQDI